MDSVSWAQFLSIMLTIVGVPTVIGAAIAWRTLLSERARDVAGGGTGRGRLGPAPTGLIGFALGFAACAGWLSWSADQGGSARGMGLPAPHEFPTWQIVACGVTVVLACLAAARLSRWVRAGGVAAAVGTAAGFATAFSVAASVGPTSQEGIGVAFAMLGWGLGLSALMAIRAAWLTERGGPPRRAGPRAYPRDRP